MTGATSVAGTENLSRALEFNFGVHVAQSLGFCVVFCKSLFIILSFTFWPLLSSYYTYNDHY